MSANTVILIILVIVSYQSCFGYYIRNSEESLAIKNRNDAWEAFQKTQGLSPKQVDLLKSQKNQQEAKELLKENPKYFGTTQKNTNTNTKAVKRPGHQINRLLRALANNLKNSNRLLSLKPLKRSRRKIVDKMVPDMSVNLMKMFYEKHNIQPSNDDGDYSDPAMFRRTQLDADSDSDYEYDNLYDDERDVALTAKSNRNLEYGSFQDLILQAKRNQWEQEVEETKLQIPHNDHFF